MYVGVISIAVMAGIVISGFAKNLLKKLKIGAGQALFLLLLFALGFVVKPFYGSSVTVGYGGLFLILLAAIWLFTGNYARIFFFNLLSTAAVAALVAAFYYFAGEFMLYYAGSMTMAATAGLLSYFLAHGARSGVVVGVSGVFLGDIIAYFSGFYPADTLALGANPQFDALVLTLTVFLALYGFIDYFSSKFGTRGRLVNKFEAAELWEEE